MANTKKLALTLRKKAKRASRKELKKLHGTLTLKQRKMLRKEEAKGIRKFIAAQEKKSD